MLRSAERFCAGLQASFFFSALPWSFSLPLPLWGEGLAIVFLGFVEFALLVYNRLTHLQQGLFGASLVSFPTQLSNPHTGPHGAEFEFTVFC